MADEYENMEQPQEETEQLDEQVGNETNDLEPEDSEELEEELQEEEQLEDEPAQQQPGGQESYEELKASFSEMKQGMGQIVNALQQMQGQQRPKQQPPQQANYQQINVPDDLDAISQKDAVRYALSQAGQHTGQQVKGIHEWTQRQLTLQNEVIGVLLDGHPKQAIITEAVRLNSRGLPWNEAYASAEGLAARGKNKQLEKQNQQFQKSSKRRGNKAKQQSRRPVNVPVKTNKNLSLNDAIAESLQEMGHSE